MSSVSEKVTLELSERYKGLIGNTAREQAVRFLTVAFGEGYLDAGQHAARTEQALAARTASDLRRSVQDLPDAITRTIPDTPKPRPLRSTGQLIFLSLLSALVTAFLCVLGTGNEDAGNGGALVTLGMAAALCAAITFAPSWGRN